LSGTNNIDIIALEQRIHFIVIGDRSVIDDVITILDSDQGDAQRHKTIMIADCVGPPSRPEVRVASQQGQRAPLLIRGEDSGSFLATLNPIVK
jgi:hypothetical protein